MSGHKKYLSAVLGGQYGLVTGLAMAVAEITWTGLASIRPPLIFLLYLGFCNIIIAGIIGAVVGIFIKLERNRQSSAILFGSVIVFVIYGIHAINQFGYLPGLRGHVARKIFISALWCLSCLTVGLIAKRMRLFLVTGPGDLRFAMVSLLLSFGFIGFFFINKVYLPDLISTTSLVANTAFLGGFLLIFALLYGLFFRKNVPVERRNWPGITILLLLLLVSVPVAIAGPVSRIEQQPLVRFHPTKKQTTTDSTPVVLIVVDTLRADHVSAYGYNRKTTPNIDRLARDSVLYRHTISTSPTTLPSHASLFTGLLPSEHGAHFVRRHQQGLNRDTSDRVPHMMPASPLPHSATTLAEVLSNQGYSCGAIVGNCAYLWRGFQLDQGFHYYDDARGVYIPMQPVFDIRNIPVLGNKLEHKFLPYRDASDVTERTIQWLEHNAEFPFLLFVNYMDAHAPYASPPGFRGMFARDSEDALMPTGEVNFAVMKGEEHFPSGMHDFLVDGYDEELRYLDSELGLLMDWLKQKGLYDSALIVITSDHGESFGEHLFLGHTNCLYEHETWVPLIIKYPRSKEAGKMVGDTASLAEVPNIILRSLRIAPLRSMAPRPISELFVNEDRVVQYGLRFDRSLRGVYKDRMKYIISSVGNVEAYDLERDPTESDNLFTGQDSSLKGIADEFGEWIRITEKEDLTGLTQSVSEKSVTERLRSLGYLN